MSRRVPLALLLLVGLLLAPAAPLAAQEPAQPEPPAEPAKPAEPKLLKYPKSITPPKGTEYPCEMVALPKAMAGVPEEHRPWVEHGFTHLLKAIHAKLVLLEKLRHGEKGAKLKKAHQEYEKATRAAIEGLEKPEAPEPLRPFRDDVLAALRGQLEFFVEAVKRVDAQPHPQGYDSIWQVPAGRTASQRLQAAYGKAQAAWGKGWDEPMRKAAYHHLCALDLF